MAKKCVILGGGGFIGSHLAERLLNSGYEVRIFDVKNFSKRNIDGFVEKVEIIEGDFSNPVDMMRALKDVDYVYHLISTTIPSNSVLNPSYDVESNIIPTIHMLQHCTEINVKKIIYISSGGTVYGIPEIVPIPESHSSNPISSYGITKRTIESYFNLYNKLWGLNTCVFRLSNPYGEHQNPRSAQGAIPVFCYKSIHNELIEVWGNGEVVRDYIYIDDVIEILTRCLVIETPELIYNLGSGKGTSLNEILSSIKQNFNPDLGVKYLAGRNFDVPSNVLDISRIKERFDWEPNIDLRTGLTLLYDYFYKCK